MPNKATLSLCSFSKCSFTISKLRFLKLRKPKISSCYAILSLQQQGYFVVTLVLEILTYASVCCGFSNFASLKLALVIQFYLQMRELLQ